MNTHDPFLVTQDQRLAQSQLVAREGVTLHTRLDSVIAETATEHTLTLEFNFGLKISARAAPLALPSGPAWFRRFFRHTVCCDAGLPFDLRCDACLHLLAEKSSLYLYFIGPERPSGNLAPWVDDYLDPLTAAAHHEAVATLLDDALHTYLKVPLEVNS